LGGRLLFILGVFLLPHLLNRDLWERKKNDL